MPPHGPWKSRTALGVTLGVVGGAIVLMVALIAGFAMRGEGTVTSSPSPVATRPTLPSPAPTNTPPPLPTTRPTAPRPTVPKPTATRTTVKPPPPRRMPPKPPGDRQVMGGDPFYRTGAMASAGCRLPDVALSNKGGVTVYYGALLRCLNNGWPRNVRAGHDVFRRPRMLMVAGYVDSPCGGTAMPRSYYCGGNEVIYMRYDQDIKQYNKYPEYYQKVFARMWAMFTVALAADHRRELPPVRLGDLAHDRHPARPRQRPEPHVLVAPRLPDEAAEPVQHLHRVAADGALTVHRSGSPAPEIPT